jgi:hypothetical protein
MSTSNNIPPDPFKPGDVWEVALSIFESQEQPVRSLEEIRVERNRKRRERAHRRLVAEMARLRAERTEYKERLQKSQPDHRDEFTRAFRFKAGARNDP